jgi:hypothetical protein
MKALFIVVCLQYKCEENEEKKEETTKKNNKRNKHTPT